MRKGFGAKPQLSGMRFLMAFVCWLHLSVAAERPAADSEVKATPSSDVEAAQVRLAEAWMQLARTQYRDSEYDRARASLQEVAANRVSHNRPIPLDGSAAAIVLDLDVEPEGFPGSWLDVRGGKRFSIVCVEKLCGPLEWERVGRWVDEASGLLVQDRGLVDRICTTFLLPDRNDTRIAVSIQVLWVSAKATRTWVERDDSAEVHRVQRVLSPDDMAKLDATIAARDGKIEEISSLRAVVPDRRVSRLSDIAQIAYVAKVELRVRGTTTVAEPMVSSCEPGTFVEILPLIGPGGTVTFCLRSTVVRLKEMRTVHIAMPVGWQEATVEVPELETHTHTCNVDLRHRESVLVGEIPARASAERESIWLRVTASTLVRR